MKDPTPETRLACRLMAIMACGPRPAHVQFAASFSANDGRLENCAAMDATRVVSLARTVRRITEAGCNRNTTPAEDRRQQRAQARADTLLRPYGLRLDHPRGLVMYAMPIDSDGTSAAGMVDL